MKRESTIQPGFTLIELLVVILGATATGIPSLGGNGKYDPRWMWDPE
jgi:type II secretory pathway pseudopilin PulG